MAGLKLGWDASSLNSLKMQLMEQIDRIKQQKIELGVNIKDDAVIKQLNSMLDAIKNVQDTAAKPIDIQVSARKSKEELAGIKGSFEDIINTYKELGQISISPTFDKNGMIKSFTVQLQQLNGLIDKVKYNANEFVDGKNSMTPISFKVNNIKEINDLDKTFAKVEDFKNKYNNAVKELQGIKIDSIAEFQRQLNSLNINNFKEKTNEIKNTYNDLLNEQKKYSEGIRQQEQLNNFVNTQQNRLNNIRAGYSGKLDAGSSQYTGLENTYKSLVNELNTYKKTEQSLTTEQSNDIKSRINDFNKEKSSIVSITNTIKQQETALDALKSRFGNIIPDSKINKLKADLQGLYNSPNLKGDSNAISQEIEKLKQLASEVQRIKGFGSNIGTFSGAGINMNSNFKDIEKFIQSTVSAKASINSINESVDSLGNKIKTVNYTINEGSNVVSKHKMTIDGNTQSIYKLNTGLQNVDEKNRSFSSGIASSVKSLLGFSAASAAVYGGINQIKDAIQNVIDLNKSQTNIQMITGMNENQVKGLTQQFSDLATQLHSTTSEMMSGAENFLRAGDSIEQTKSMLKATDIGAALSGQSTQDVADQLIAISNGFRMNTKDAKAMMDVVSKLTKADNDSATSFKEISTAMQGSSAMAQSAKVDFDHLLAYISTVSSVTRENASSIGTSFQSQFARYQNVKGGQKFDAEGQDLSNVERDLSKYANEHIRSDSGTFKSYETVLDDLAKKWGNLSEVSKAAISKAMAGVQHANDFQVLMQNYDKVKSMLKDVGDSAGYAEDKFNNIWDKSTQAKIKDFQHAVENLYQSMVTSGTVNKALQGLTNFIHTLDTLTTSAPKSGIALAGLATALVLVIKNGSKVTGLFSRIGILLNNFFIISSKAGIIAGLADTFNILATSIRGVTLALLKNPLTLVIAGIGIASAVIINHIQKQEAMKEKTDQLKTSYENLTQAMKDNDSASIKSSSQNLKNTQDTLQNLIKQRNELQKKTNNPVNTGDPRVDSAMNSANINQLGDVNKKIKEQEQALNDAGVAYNKTTGEIMSYTEAQNRIQALDTVDKINKTSQSEIEHKNTIIELGNEYNKLAQLQKPTIDQQDKMSELSKTLSNDIAGLTTAKDKDGNVTIKNGNLLNAEIGILGQEGVSVNTLKQIKLSAAKSNEQVQVGETKMTYEQATARVKILQNEAKSWAGVANMPFVPEGVKKLAKGYSKNSKQQADEIQSSLDSIDQIYKNVDKSTSDLTDENDNGYTPSEEKATDATKANTEAQKAQKAIIDQVKEATKEYETELKNLDNIQNTLETNLKHMDKTSEEYRQGLQQEIDLLKQKNGFLQQGVSLNNSSINKLSGYASGGGSQLGQEVVNQAEQYLGTPYVWGGESPSGFDCSGLVQYVYDKVGVQLNRTTYDQFKQGTPVSKADLQPGDLVFFAGSDGSLSSPGHVAIYAGGGEIIEAPYTGASVRVSSLDGRSDYAGARRVLSGSSSGSVSTTSMTYSDIINAASAQYGVDPSVIAAVIQQESTWNPTAKGGNGVGLMQLEPSADAEVGLPDDQRTDPYKNIMAGTAYLAKMINKYGSVEAGLSHYNGGTKGSSGYARAVMAIEQQYANGSLSIPDKSVDVTGDTDVLSEMDDLNSKSEDYQKQMIDNSSQILDLYTEKYNSQLDAFKAQIDSFTKLQDYNKQQYELLRETDSASADKYAKAELEDENDIYGALLQKEKFIRSQMQQNVFDKATLAQMQNDLLDTQEQEVETINKLHTDFTEWQDNALTDAIKPYNDQLTEIQAQLDIVSTKDKNNYKDQLDLNRQELTQQENIKARTLERLAAIKELIAAEKNDTTRQILIDEYDKINNELLTTEKEIATIQNNIDEFDLENRLKQYADDITKINNELDILNDKTDSSRANGENVENFDKKIDDYQQIISDLDKQNDAYTKQIKLLIDLRNEFEQGTEQYTEYNDKINDAMQKQTDLQKQKIDTEKQLEQVYEDEVLNRVQGVIYGGQTQQEFEDAAKARENAIDAQLKEMDKQNQALQEQETRDKNLLDLEQARVKLQQDQNNRSVQQLTKDKNGNWQFTYVADQSTVDQDEQDLRDKQQSQNDWEHETQQQHLQDQLNDEKEQLEQEVQIRQEAMDRIKTNIENAFNDQKNLFSTGQTDIAKIVKDSLSQMEDLYGSSFGNIVNTVSSSVESILSEIGKLNPGFVNAQNGITGVTNPTTPAATQHIVYGSDVDLQNAKAMLGTNGYTYKDISKMTDEEKKNLTLGDNDILLGGAAVTYGITENQNGGTGTRLWGQDRNETNARIAEYAEKQGANHFIYAAGEDLVNARKIYGDSYQYIPTDGWTENEWSQVHPQAGDRVIGTQASTPGLSLGNATRWGGADRGETAEQMKSDALASGSDTKRNVYASGQDYENALKTLNSAFYNVIDTAKIDLSEVQLTGNDWVLGGEAVTPQALNNQMQSSGAKRIYGQTAADTNKELQKYRDQDLANVEKYNQNVTKEVKSSTQQQTIIIQDSQTKESTAIQVGANTNLGIITQSMNDIYDVSYNGMGQVVLTVKDNVNQAIDAIQQLLDAETAVGMTPNSTTPTQLGNVSTKPYEFATGADAAILKAQFGDALDIYPGIGMSGRPGTTRYDTNALYLADIAKKWGLTPTNSNVDMSKFDTGGYTGDWGSSDGKLGVLHQKEMILNEDDTPNILKAVDLIRDINVDGVARIFNNIASNNILDNIVIPTSPGVVNNKQSLQPTQIVHQYHIDKLEFPNAIDGQDIVNALTSLDGTVKQYTSSYKYGY